MNHPKGLTMDERGNIYIADTMNMAIRKISDAGKLQVFKAFPQINEHSYLLNRSYMILIFQLKHHLLLLITNLIILTSIT